jgi:hypothetical protein
MGSSVRLGKLKARGSGLFNSFIIGYRVPSRPLYIDPRESDRTIFGSESGAECLAGYGLRLGSGLAEPSRVDGLADSPRLRGPGVPTLGDWGLTFRGADGVGRGGSLVREEGGGDLRSGRLVALGTEELGGDATAFRVIVLGSGCVTDCEGSGGRSLKMAGDASRVGSGDEAGEMGEAKVLGSDVLTSSFWYSGVGGLWAAGRAVDSLLLPGEFSSDRRETCSLFLSC